MTQFQIGKSYFARSIGDYDCIFRHTILARTAKTVTIHHNGSDVKRAISFHNGVEQFKPYGSHSMCAIIRADREG